MNNSDQFNYGNSLWRWLVSRQRVTQSSLDRLRYEKSNDAKKLRILNRELRNWDKLLDMVQDDLEKVEAK